MPRPRATRARRTRGSWTPRIAGLGAAILVAAVAVIAYVVAGPASAARHPEQLSRRVLSVQTVGIVGQAAAGAKTSLRQLTVSAGRLQFGPMPTASLQEASPQWTADAMAGGTYIFIYADSGQCLGSAGPRRRPVLTLQRCDLGARQRWQRLNAVLQPDGHQYGQYRNSDSGRCLATGVALGQQADNAATLAACGRSASPAQLISFWWAA